MYMYVLYCPLRAYLMYCCRAGFLLDSTLTSPDMTPVLHRLRVRTLLATNRIFSKFTSPSINVSFPMFRKYASFVTRGMNGISGGETFDWYARRILWLRDGSCVQNKIRYVDMYYANQHRVCHVHVLDKSYTLR